jgi:hypothetical protein
MCHNCAALTAERFQVTSWLKLKLRKKAVQASASRKIFEKLVVAQLLNKFFDICINRKLVAVFPKSSPKNLP